MTKKGQEEKDLSISLPSWKAFHQRLLEWFAANPHRYGEILQELKTEVGFTKYQGPKGLQAFRQAVSRVRNGQGALREPLLLGRLLREVGWEPRELFGLPNNDKSASPEKLGVEIGKYIVGVLREEQRKKNPPDNLPGGPKKQLAMLRPLAMMIIGFARNHFSSGTTILQSFHTWMTPTWHRIVPKPEGRLAIDERLWFLALRPQPLQDLSQYENAGLLLVLVHATYLLQRVYSSLVKLSGSAAKKERIVLEYEDQEADHKRLEKVIRDITVELESVVDRLDGPPDSLVSLDRRALLTSIQQVANTLEAFTWSQWHIKYTLGDNEVEIQRGWLRYVLLHEKQGAFRNERRFFVSRGLEQSLASALRLLGWVARGDSAAIQRYFEPGSSSEDKTAQVEDRAGSGAVADQELAPTLSSTDTTVIVLSEEPTSIDLDEPEAVAESQERRKQFLNGLDPLFFGTTIEELVRDGVLAVLDKKAWQNRIDRAMVGQKLPGMTWSTAVWVLNNHWGRTPTGELVRLP